MRVLLNTSTTSSHHLVAPEHEDIIIISRIGNSDKCSDQDEENDENSFKNSNAEELKVILSQSESEDEVCQDHQFSSERRAFSLLKNHNKIIKQEKSSQASDNNSESTISVLVSQNITVASCK